MRTVPQLRPTKRQRCAEEALKSHPSVLLSNRVARVLLADGWHTPISESFRLEKFGFCEYIDETAPNGRRGESDEVELFFVRHYRFVSAGDAVSAGVASMRATWQEERDGNTIRVSAPMTAVLALEH